ncbi:glycosyltransferase family 4 protein [Paenibacillus sp. MMS18-CY102]|uniref:glycosyltransferase family 4 protein n=1 Tax=Paenibacillus sp. MMS18-CY102 TaxID=2682849 RepID=UPI001366035F|nr:glycosyltransferase [Paenibacillus sp. MMS18-CY102]MWC28641.1 glycosyltransferase [Paenibacillus sp. MMS18-CY102]
MKLLFTYFVPSGGIETLNRLRARILRRIGIESHLFYLWDGAGVQNLIHTDIPYLVSNDDHHIATMLALHQYDAIIVTCDHFLLDRLRGHGYKGPILYEAQGLGTREQALSTLREASPYIRKHAQAVLGPQTSHLIAAYTGYFPDLPRFYMHNPVNIEQFHYRTLPQANPDGAPVLAWIGRLESNKNVSLCLRIAAHLARAVPNLQLWMFVDLSLSEPDQRQSFEKLVHELNLSNRLKLLSNIPHHQMADYLSAVGDSGGFLLSTSGTEGFGYAIAEAMSCRCPVLSTDSDGVRTFIEHGRTGLFFRTGKVEEGVLYGLQLLNDREATNRMRDAAYSLMKTAFSPNRYCADLNNVLVALGIRPPL